MRNFLGVFGVFGVCLGMGLLAMACDSGTNGNPGGTKSDSTNLSGDWYFRQVVVNGNYTSSLSPNPIPIRDSVDYTGTQYYLNLRADGSYDFAPPPSLQTFMSTSHGHWTANSNSVTTVDSATQASLTIPISELTPSTLKTTITVDTPMTYAGIPVHAQGTAKVTFSKQ